MRSVKITRLPVGAQFVLLVGLALGMFGFAAPALAQPGAPTNVMITPTAPTDHRFSLHLSMPLGR